MILKILLIIMMIIAFFMYLVILGANKCKTDRERQQDEEEEIKALKKAHKDVQIYTSCVNRCLNKNKYILPGLGDAGDRVYGTK